MTRSMFIVVTVLTTALCACERPTTPDRGDEATSPTAPATQPGAAQPGDGPGEPAVPGGSAASAVEQACPGIGAFDTTSAQMCTEMGCPDGFELAVRNVPHMGPGWPHGTYVYKVTVDGEQVECSGALPLQGCGTPSMTCTSDLVTIEEVGCALGPDTQAFGGVHFARGRYPSAVRLVIERDGQSLLDQSFTPQYRAVQPNGTGCGPVCCQARAELDVPLTP